MGTTRLNDRFLKHTSIARATTIFIDDDCKWIAFVSSICTMDFSLWLPLPPPTADISAPFSKCTTFRFFNSTVIFQIWRLIFQILTSEQNLMPLIMF